MQQSSATPSLHLWFWGVAEDCCMLSLLLAVPSCIYSFWHGVIPTSYFIFTLVVLYMSLPQYIPNCLLVSTVFGTVSSLHPTSFLMIFTLVYKKSLKMK